MPCPATAPAESRKCRTLDQLTGNPELQLPGWATSEDPDQSAWMQQKARPITYKLFSSLSLHLMDLWGLRERSICCAGWPKKWIKKLDTILWKNPKFASLAQHAPTWSRNSKILYVRIVRLLQNEQITAQSWELARQTGPGFSGGALTDVTGRLPKTSYCGHSRVEAQHWSTWWMSYWNQSSRGFVPALNSCMGRPVRGEERCGHSSRCLSGFHTFFSLLPSPFFPLPWNHPMAFSCCESTTNICWRTGTNTIRQRFFLPPPAQGRILLLHTRWLSSPVTLMGLCTI